MNIQLSSQDFIDKILYPITNKNLFELAYIVLRKYNQNNIDIPPNITIENYIPKTDQKLLDLISSTLQDQKVLTQLGTQSMFKQTSIDWITRAIHNIIELLDILIVLKYLPINNVFKVDAELHLDSIWSDTILKNINNFIANSLHYPQNTEETFKSVYYEDWKPKNDEEYRIELKDYKEIYNLINNYIKLQVDGDANEPEGELNVDDYLWKLDKIIKENKIYPEAIIVKNLERIIIKNLVVPLNTSSPAPRSLTYLNTKQSIHNLKPISLRIAFILILNTYFETNDDELNLPGKFMTDKIALIILQILYAGNLKEMQEFKEIYQENTRYKPLVERARGASAEVLTSESMIYYDKLKILPYHSIERTNPIPISFEIKISPINSTADIKIFLDNLNFLITINSDAVNYNIVLKELENIYKKLRSNPRDMESDVWSKFHQTEENVYTKFEKSNYDINNQDNSDKKSILHYSIIYNINDREQNSTDTQQTFFDKYIKTTNHIKPDMNIKDIHGNTPLHIIIGEGQSVPGIDPAKLLENFNKFLKMLNQYSISWDDTIRNVKGETVRSELNKLRIQKWMKTDLLKFLQDNGINLIQEPGLPYEETLELVVLDQPDAFDRMMTAFTRGDYINTVKAKKDAIQIIPDNHGIDDEELVRDIGNSILKLKMAQKLTNDDYINIIILSSYYFKPAAAGQPYVVSQDPEMIKYIFNKEGFVLPVKSSKQYIHLQNAINLFFKNNYGEEPTTVVKLYNSQELLKNDNIPKLLVLLKEKVDKFEEAIRAAAQAAASSSSAATGQFSAVDIVRKKLYYLIGEEEEKPPPRTEDRAADTAVKRNLQEKLVSKVLEYFKPDSIDEAKSIFYCLPDKCGWKAIITREKADRAASDRRVRLLELMRLPVNKMKTFAPDGRWVDWQKMFDGPLVRSGDNGFDIKSVTDLIEKSGNFYVAQPAIDHPNSPITGFKDALGNYDMESDNLFLVLYNYTLEKHKAICNPGDDMTKWENANLLFDKIKSILQKNSDLWQWPQLGMPAKDKLKQEEWCLTLIQKILNTWDFSYHGAETTFDDGTFWNNYFKKSWEILTRDQRMQLSVGLDKLCSPRTLATIRQVEAAVEAKIKASVQAQNPLRGGNHNKTMRSNSKKSNRKTLKLK